MFQNLNAFFRTVVLAGAVLLAGWWTLFLRGKLDDRGEELRLARSELDEITGELQASEQRVEVLGASLEEREEEIGELEALVQEKELEIQALDVAMQLLKVDHRVARIEVLGQGATEAEPERVRTRLRFVELDANGEPIGEGRDLTVEGKTVYVETLVVKFGDGFVEKGDALRGTSICLFRRLFGANQKPSEGPTLDAAGLQPLAYTGDEGPNALHLELWQNFWDYANDPERARQVGVRAIHGEAPFIEMRPGKTYRVELRASGGLTIQTE